MCCPARAVEEKMMKAASYMDSRTKEEARRQKFMARTAELELTIRPLRSASYECDHDWNYIQRALEGYGADYGGLELNPDFQRGHVWTHDQQLHYIENVLRGVVSSSGFVIQFNCPNWDLSDYEGDLPRGFQCVDGLQRLTAVGEFLAGNVRPFGFCPDDLDGSSFKSKYHFRFAIHNFTRRVDLLQHYLDLNAGGTPHAPEEIERVRQMRDAAAAEDECEPSLSPPI
jgi:hypothetical protein